MAEGAADVPSKLVGTDWCPVKEDGNCGQVGTAQATRETRCYDSENVLEARYTSIGFSGLESFLRLHSFFSLLPSLPMTIKKKHSSFTFESPSQPPPRPPFHGEGQNTVDNKRIEMTHLHLHRPLLTATRTDM